MSVLELVEALHPTPAVCGVPRDEALEFLLAAEPFQRGWYAGPVGWFDTEGEGHFVPALRTAVGDGRSWRLFTGAGIVDGSRPSMEWEETGKVPSRPPGAGGLGRGVTRGGFVMRGAEA